MASPVPVTAISLLVLLVFVSLPHQASAGAPRSLLETLSLFSGHYERPSYNGKVLDEDYMFICQPVDIPALNQYFPSYILDVDNGEPIREGIYLITVGSDGTYLNTLYKFNNFSKFSTPDLDLSIITRDDLATEPACSEEISRRGDAAVSLSQCFDDPETVGILSEFVFTCNYSDGRNLPTETLQETPVIRIWKSEQYPLPSSWLEGNEDYVDPCMP